MTLLDERPTSQQEHPAPPPATSPGRHLAKRTLLYVVLVLGALPTLLPLFWLVRSALMGTSQIFTAPPEWVPHPFEWANFSGALTAAPFARYFLNTMIVEVFAVTGTVLSCSLAAFSLARLRWRGRNAVFALLMSGLMMPYAVTLIPTFMMWKALGAVDTFVPLTLPAFFGSHLYGGMFTVFLLRQFFLTIPFELDEAAYVDGATPFGVFWRVVLPLSEPALLVVTLFTALSVWNDYLNPLIYLSSQEHYTLAVGLASFQGTYTAQWGYLMAAATVVVAPMVALFLFAQRYFVEGIALTGMKGLNQMTENQHTTTRRTLIGGVGGAAAVVGTGALGGLSPASAAPLPPAGGGDHWLRDVPPDQLDQTPSRFFSTVFVEEAGTVAAAGSDGDLWPSCWADDGYVYTANGDGRGFSDEPFQDIVVSRMAGRPETGLSGIKLAEADEVGTVWADPAQYNRKPTGMVCVDGVLYLAIQDLKKNDNAFDDAPNASISKSTDHGRTWQKTSEPMFTDHRFTTIFFCDFGKDSRHARTALGARDGRYVYAYGMDWNWRTSNTGTVPDPTALFLARVLPQHLQERSRWQFYVGRADGRPRWGRFEDKVPVLSDPLRRFTDTRPGKGGNLTTVSQGGVLYNAPLRRYLYTSWTDPSFEFYESPTPWGPWKRFLYHDFGLVDWYQMSDQQHTPKNGGYGTTIPSKFVSDDGLTMWVQSNWWTAPYPKPEDNYNFNLRKLVVTPHRRRRATNQRDRRANLARTGAHATGIQVCAHYGNVDYPHDGDRTRSEDSFDGTNKLVDYWGVTFARPYRMNRVVYTTGQRFDDGGWFDRFDGGLRVQVRRGFEWVDVGGVDTSPRYPYGPGATPYKTYTMRFPTVTGDGVRIIGQPGGGAHFTSIAELEVYYA